MHLQCGRPGFGPWVGKIPWRRERLPTPILWPGESHGLYSPWGRKESDTTERLSFSLSWASLVVLLVKNLPANSGDRRDLGSISRSGGSPGGGNGNSLYYSCVENLMDREAWRATVYRVAKNQKPLKWLSTPCMQNSGMQYFSALK